MIGSFSDPFIVYSHINLFMDLIRESDAID